MTWENESQSTSHPPQVKVCVTRSPPEGSASNYIQSLYIDVFEFEKGAATLQVPRRRKGCWSSERCHAYLFRLMTASLGRVQQDYHGTRK